MKNKSKQNENLKIILFKLAEYKEIPIILELKISVVSDSNINDK